MLNLYNSIQKLKGNTQGLQKISRDYIRLCLPIVMTSYYDFTSKPHCQC